MNIPNYVDSFKSDDDIFYYPKSVIESHNSNINFTKIVTFQWRRVWPKGRTGQQRILGNGPELAEKLAQHLPKNILVRLIDTARLPISEQIAILRKTDYYVGMHGAGLCLSIYSPNHCIRYRLNTIEFMYCVCYTPYSLVVKPVIHRQSEKPGAVSCSIAVLTAELSIFQAALR